MKLYLLLLFIIACNVISLNSQNNSNDANLLFEEGKKLISEEKNFTEGVVTTKKAADLLQKNQQWQTLFECYYLLDRAYFYSSRLDSALIYINKELELAEAYPDVKFKFNLSDIHKQKGVMLYYMTKYEEARKEFLLVLDIEENKEEPDFTTLAGIYSNLGNLDTDLGNLEKGFNYFEKALNILESNNLGQTQEAGITYSSLGVELKRAGKLYEAIQNYQKALSIFENCLSPNHPYFGDLYVNMKIAYFQIGNYQLAYDIGKKSLEADRAVYGDNHPYIAQGMLFLRRCQYNFEDNENSIEEAIKISEQALKIFKDYFGEDHMEVVNSHSHLSLDYFKAKRYQEAIEIAKKGLAISRRISGNRSHHTVNALNDLAIFYEGANEPDSALAICQEIIINITEKFDNEDYRSNPSFEDFNNLSMGLDAINFKSRQLFTLNKSVELVQANSNLGDEIIRKILFKGNVLEDREKVFAELGRHNYGHGLKASFLKYEKDPSEENYQECFKFSEQGKSLVLLSSLMNSEALSFSTLPEAEIEKEKKYKAEITKLESLLFEASNAEDSLLIFSSLFDANKTFNEFLDHLNQEYPKYYQNKYDIPFANCFNTSQILNDNELFISYSFGPAYKNLYLFTIQTDGKYDLITQVVPSELKSSVLNYHKLLQSPALSRKDRRLQFIQLSNELYNFFIKPIEQTLLGKEKLIIVGDDLTYYIPFETLLKNNTDKNLVDLDFLIKDFEISYHYSATLFAKSRELNKNKGEGLLAFAPVFQNDQSEGNYLASLRGNLDENYRAINSDGKISPLIHSFTEVKTIEKLFQDKTQEKTYVLVNEDANETQLKHQLGNNYRVIHIASHSFSNQTFPKFSGIVCSSSDTPENIEDDVLYVGEIYNHQLTSDLVVLSSCESGLGKLNSGQGLIGLNRSFLYAGASNVIFSLWKVLDKSSSDLMINFYSSLLNGADYSAALRQAKLKMLKNKQTATPNFWSGFLLIGR